MIGETTKQFLQVPFKTDRMHIFILFERFLSGNRIFASL